ncbi:L-2-hydroxyglutarate oxidase [Pararhizobium haloflavum]|uniref:L-2-hydroxyglutarate oxidase n=1 Tax=Pararhizobium haloflavum TaxID=2037914 RepID=UPI000C18D907|nr:L-2-hydroxyglutarate oxidase [Pararhizobium haloflavum]
MTYDFCVVGGGIVGLATALNLLEMKPDARLVLIEKEDGVGRHQTGHNSGVIHAGIYYAPGSLKARLCTEGAEATKRFCAEEGIAVDTCGKLIVATSATEMQRIDALHDRATKNGLTLQRIGRDHLREIEPNIVGQGALLSPKTAIVDYRAVAAAMAARIRRAGGEILLRRRVDRIEVDEDAVEVGAGGEAWRAGYLVTCAGLQSDRIARLAGARTDFRILPFRGEYYRLPAARNDIVRHLIYPAPDPSLPFLGIHLTKMIDGGITVGPNAVLGLAREGYGKLAMAPQDMWDIASFSGFWRLLAQQRKNVAEEAANSLSKRRYLEKCRLYCPDLTLDDLLPQEAGIRAQAVTAAGEMIHDFLFVEGERSLHVCNAPSPAATSALPIGRMVAERCLDRALDRHAAKGVRRVP